MVDTTTQFEQRHYPELIAIAPRQVADGQFENTVNARDLWSKLEVKKDFSAWYKTQVKRAKLIENRDFVSESVTPLSGGMVRIEYHLTVDAAKHIAMMSGTDRGCDVRDYFIQCERRAKQAAAIDPMLALTDPASLRVILLRYVDKSIEQQRVIDEQAPIVAGFNRIAEHSIGSLCVTDASKHLGTGRTTLFQWLQSHGWIYRRQGSDWIGYQTKITANLLEHKVITHAGSGGTEHVKSQVRITAKGLAHLAKIFATVPAERSAQGVN